MSSKPLLSPIIWTTIATGKTPDQHHIGHFVAVNEKTGEQLPVTSQMRKVKALWNILSDAGRRSTSSAGGRPGRPRRVNGAIVSDHTCYHFLFEDGATGGAPSDRASSIRRRCEPAMQPLITPARRSDAGRRRSRSSTSAPRSSIGPFAFDDDLSHFKWALATAESYRAHRHVPVAGATARTCSWSTSRAPTRWRTCSAICSAPQGLAGELAAQQERYGDAVEQMYQYADRLVGEYHGDDGRPTRRWSCSPTTASSSARCPTIRARRATCAASASATTATEGILYLYGNHVQGAPRARPADACSTSRRRCWRSAACRRRATCRGACWTKALDICSRAARTWRATKTGRAQIAARRRDDASVDPAILEHLRSLGYLDAQSPKGDRNLAAVLFQDGQVRARPARPTQTLVETDPDDGGAARQSGRCARRAGPLRRVARAAEQGDRASSRSIPRPTTTAA